jgi:hypothetical protein
METKFQKGDLVLVKHMSSESLFSLSFDEEVRHGVVMDVRPHVLGGTGVRSWRDGGWEITHEEKRSEYLVVSPSGDFQSWFDEKNLGTP